MKVRFAMLAAVAGVALATSAQAAFVAYNDCSPSGSTNPANTTVYTSGGSGQLKDFATGTPVQETVAVVNTGSAATGGTGPNVPFTTGTPAANAFTGKADAVGTVLYYGGSTGWSYDLVFTNLVAGTKYNLTTTIDRGNTSPAPSTGYIDRWTAISIMDADAFTNASSAGAFVVNTSKVSIVSMNDVNGDVAKWTDIDPGADGDFTIHFTVAANASERPVGATQESTGYKAYGPAVFALEAVVPEPTSLSLLGLAALPLIRRRRA